MGPLAALLGDSPAMRALRESAARLLQHPSDRGRLPSLLIQGETGAGKGVLARALHDEGPRKDQLFLDLNCAAIPKPLLEAELFGFERGAFTDARQPKPGLFQAANRGTLFLDEVGELPLELQAKLLKVLEDRAVRRLGATRTEPVDIWIITASNKDLRAEMRARRFREDLYHRLAVVTLALPPLRERGADVILLAEHFLAGCCAEYGQPAKTLAPDARSALLAHPWRGNVRELSNTMERITLLVDTPVVTAATLDLSPVHDDPDAGQAEPPAPTRGLGATMDAVERDQIMEALDDSIWNVTRAARQLGISRDTLRYRIAKHQLRPGGHRAPRPPAPPAESVTPPSPAPRAATAQDAPASVVRWEQRRVTLLRAVIDGPQPEDDRLYPSRLIEALIEKARGFGGRVEDLGPTGVVASFGLEPVEDATRRAAHAAIAIRKAVERDRPAQPPWITVRVGIHVTQLLVGHAGREIRLELEGKRRAWDALEGLLQRAEPDRTVVSEPAAPFLDRRFALASPLPHRLQATARCTGSRVSSAAASGRAAGSPCSPAAATSSSSCAIASPLRSKGAARSWASWARPGSASPACSWS
jgi:DNA-binding NtrC family response regulator